MMNKQLLKSEFNEFVKSSFPQYKNSLNYLYEMYEETINGILEVNEESHLFPNFEINSYDLIYYLLGEYSYSTEGLSPESVKKFEGNEKIKESMSSVVADKFLSLSLYNRHEEKFTNRYIPPISSMDLYLNLMDNILHSYKRNDPQNTLIIDLLNKSISISRCIVKLLCDGYETEALSMWRTLHECECTLILLDQYQATAINAYIKHMQYGMAYKNAIPNKEQSDKLFYQMKEEMSKYDLKSKDIKKYIEYGWLYAIDDYKKVENFKLNFRDGLETLAGLHQYSDIYMTSSEILHSTPLLIYSNKRYFYYMALLNLYESFFRIEKVFTSLFLSRAEENIKNQYLEMRKLYYSQLINIHQREVLAFKKNSIKKEPK